MSLGIMVALLREVILETLKVSDRFPAISDVPALQTLQKPRLIQVLHHGIFHLIEIHIYTRITYIYIYTSYKTTILLSSIS